MYLSTHCTTNMIKNSRILWKKAEIDGDPYLKAFKKKSPFIHTLGGKCEDSHILKGPFLLPASACSSSTGRASASASTASEASSKTASKTASAASPSPAENAQYGKDEIG